MYLDLAAVGLGHGGLVALAGEVSRDRARGPASDVLDRGRLRLRGCGPGDGLLGVFV